MDFEAFGGAPPIIGEALILSHLPQNDWRGHWLSHNYTVSRHPPLCMIDALPGMPDPPEYPTAPPNEFCDPGWHVLINENGQIKCVQMQGRVGNCQFSVEISTKYHNFWFG